MLSNKTAFYLSPLAVGLAWTSLMSPASAEFTNGALKLGVMTDFSSIYADAIGDSSVIAVQMAVEDFGGQMNGKPIEIIKADFQNKADLALTITRKWIEDDAVDVIVDAPNSGIAVAIGKYVAEKNKVYLSGAGSSDITGKFCLPNTVQFEIDTYALAAVAAEAIVKKGMKTWFSITADYAMGHSLEADTTKILNANGGQMVGSVRHPFGAPDMSSFVLQAQNSKAQVLAVSSAGTDAVNIEKTAAQFGVNKQMQVVALQTLLIDVYRNSKILAGSYHTESWYWDMNDETRAWTERFVQRHPKKFYPSRAQASTYSMTLAYLNAVKALNDDNNGKAIVDKMKATVVNDMYVKGGRIREDGRLIIDTYLSQVKQPEDIKKGWDLYNMLEKVPGEKSFRPVAESECSLLKK